MTVTLSLARHLSPCSAFTLLMMSIINTLISYPLSVGFSDRSVVWRTYPSITTYSLEFAVSRLSWHCSWTEEGIRPSPFTDRASPPRRMKIPLHNNFRQIFLTFCQYFQLNPSYELESLAHSVGNSLHIWKGSSRSCWSKLFTNINSLPNNF